MSKCYSRLEKRNPAKNQARFYTMHMVPTLFGSWSLVREWGRIGSPGRVLEEWFDTLEECQLALVKWEQKKLKKGYQTR